MKKFIAAIFIAGFIWFFFVYESPYSEFTNEGITTDDQQFIETLIEGKKESTGIVENEKLLAIIKRNLKEMIDQFNSRNKECLINAEEFFKKSKKEIFAEKNILNNLDYVFKNTLMRLSAEKLYEKLTDLM